MNASDPLLPLQPASTSHNEHLFPTLTAAQIQRIAAHSAGTLRLKEFLTRNRHPFHYRPAFRGSISRDARLRRPRSSARKS